MGTHLVLPLWWTVDDIVGVNSLNQEGLVIPSVQIHAPVNRQVAIHGIKLIPTSRQVHYNLRFIRTFLTTSSLSTSFYKCKQVTVSVIKNVNQEKKT